MPTPSIQILRTDAQQVLNLDSISAVRSVVAASLANANAGTPLNPNLTTQQLWNEFYQIVTQPKSDIESIIANQLMKFLYAPPAPGGAGADKQVIFNDGGVLAGDPGLTYDKTTDALTIGGNINVSGDGAFIGTGRVGLQRPFIPTGQNGTTTLDYRWYSTGTTYVTGARIRASSEAAWSAASTPARLMFETVPSGATALVERYRISGEGVHTWLNVEGVLATAMTLNNNGLGLGAGPSFKFHVQQTLAGTASTVNPIAYIVNNGSGNTAKLTLSDAVTTDGNITLTGSATAANQLLGFGINGVQQMVLNGNGNVGIGVTPSAWWVGFKAVESSNGVALLAQTNVPYCHLVSNAYDGATNFKYKLNNNYALRYAQDATVGSHIWFNAPSSGVSGAGTNITFTPAMTLDASGNLFLGAAVATAQGRQEITFDGNTNQGLNIVDSGAAATSTAIGFVKSSGTRGNILVTATGTTYNTVSDYRLKEFVKPISGGLARVNALKPSVYNWKSAGSIGEGFIAHELAEVVPSAVSGEKDAVNADGSINAQSVDMSRIVPILVAAIQELTARLQTLEAR